MKVQQTKSDPMPRGKNEIQAYDGRDRSVYYATEKCSFARKRKQWKLLEGDLSFH